MVSDYVKKLESDLYDKLEEYFPEILPGTKSKNFIRSQVLLLITMAKELGVQGHADYIKSKKFTSLGEHDEK